MISYMIVILNMDYYVSMDGMKISVVYVRVLIIGQHNIINVVSSIAFVFDKRVYLYLYLFLVRKGEINDTCEIDYQCHREIGLVCDKPPNVSKKICVNRFSFFYFVFQLFYELYKHCFNDLGMCSESLLGERFELW